MSSKPYGQKSPVRRSRELSRLKDRLRAIADEFPSDIREVHLRNLDRTVYDVSLTASRVNTGGNVLDLGGGLSLFTVGCSLVGLRPTLMDDFGDPLNLRDGADPLDVHRKLGVAVAERDLVAAGLDMPPQSVDAATCFHSMEHWHHSPKRLFSDVGRVLRPGGLFLLAGPNCVNLRKRLTALAGRAKWSSMADWYEHDTFRGHVREPDVHDLRYIARDMSLVDIDIFGRNWLGCRSPHPVTRALTRLSDRALRAFPALCSDIYLMGFVPDTVR